MEREHSIKFFQAYHKKEQINQGQNRKNTTETNPWQRQILKLSDVNMVSTVMSLHNKVQNFSQELKTIKINQIVILEMKILQWLKFK